MKHDKQYILDELDRRILHGLYLEWERALWTLKRHHRTMMKKPFITLREMTGRLGMWSGLKQEITMDRNFVLNYPWDSIREVLVHEMAHQFTEQVLGVMDEPPHGTAFQKACQFLRANPRASGTYKPLNERIQEEITNESDKILLKVKKLMALAESSNAHEAEAAMVKAYSLISKYNIDLITQNKKRDYVSIFVGSPSLRHSLDEYRLGRLLIDFYFVEGIWVQAYVIEKEKMGRVLEISGSIQNVKIASYIYDFIRRYIQSQWEEYKKGKRLNHNRRIDFAVGIINGFRSKLEAKIQAAEKSESDKNLFALIKVKDPVLDKYVRYRYPRLSSVRGSGKRWDKDVYDDGIQVGKQLVIAQGITETGTGGKLLSEK